MRTPSMHKSADVGGNVTHLNDTELIWVALNNAFYFQMLFHIYVFVYTYMYKRLFLIPNPE